MLRTRAADTSLASDHMWPHPKAVHMNASDQNTAAHILQEGAVHICSHPYLRDLLSLSAPSEIEARVAFHRSSAVYRAVMNLAKAMERLKSGKPARKLLGIF